MDGSSPLPPAFLEWLDHVLDRLERLEFSDSRFDAAATSREIAGKLWQLRRECLLLSQSLSVQVENGQLRQGQMVRMKSLLGDLRWLLEVSPWASPVLARQCLRIARDRINGDAEEVPGVPSAVELGRTLSCAAA